MNNTSPFKFCKNQKKKLTNNSTKEVTQIRKANFKSGSSRIIEIS